jgi:hypothetical protein
MHGAAGVGEGGGMQVAAHSRTCRRWLWVSATTTRPSLSMAMPPQGKLNCPLPDPPLAHELPVLTPLTPATLLMPEPPLPMVRTWAPSL